MAARSFALVSAAVVAVVVISGCTKPCESNLCYQAGGGVWTATFDGSMNKSRVASVFDSLGLEPDTNATYQVWARNDSATFVAEQPPRASLDEPPRWTLQGRFGDGEYFYTREGAEREAEAAMRWTGGWFNQTLAAFEAAYGATHVDVEGHASISKG